MTEKDRREPAEVSEKARWQVFALSHSIGFTELNQECSIARLLYFVEKFWPELLRFSRRTESQIKRWAARYGMKLHPWEMMDAANGRPDDLPAAGMTKCIVLPLDNMLY